jgi:nanoRNase/pAp phosphatase (c-di-AMP/oligoRNAs hydrolase)
MPSVLMTIPDAKRRLMELMEPGTRKGRVLILMHDNPDPDSIASALGLQFLLKDLAGQDSTLAYAGIIGRAENRAMVKYLHVHLAPLSVVNWDDYPGVALVDTQPLTGNNSLPEDRSPTLVIDHHPLRSATRKVAFHEVRPDYNATASIVAEFAIASRLKINTRLATAFFYAIKSETEGLGREVGQVEARLQHHLYPMIDQKLLARIENARVPREYFKVIHAALEHSQIFGDVVIARVEQATNPDIIAEVADLLMRLEKARWSFCFGTFNGDILVSARTTERHNDAGQLMRKAVGDWGTAGGHEMMAGAKICVKSSSLAHKRQVIRQLIQRLLEMTAAPDPRGEKLIDY